MKKRPVKEIEARIVSAEESLRSSQTYVDTIIWHDKLTSLRRELKLAKEKNPASS